MNDGKRLGTPLFIFFLHLIALAVTGQRHDPITVDLRHSSFADFVRQVESSSGYHFYYDSSETNSLSVNINVFKTPLTDLLDSILISSDLSYAIDDDLNVYVFNKANSFITGIPDRFFDNVTQISEDRASENAPAGNDEVSKAGIASEENKLYDIGSSDSKQASATIAGYVRDFRNGEALPGASVFADNGSTGVTTDQFGYYSLSLPTGRHSLKISSIGMKETNREIVLYSDGNLNVELHENVPTLKTVVIVSERNSNIKRLQMGLEHLSIKTIRSVPVLMGESDILRVVLTLPGVTSVGEGSTGFNVRGGSADQNLILYNGATIYNPSHLFGFFSAFNPDVIKNVELYKSSVPAKYGGRLSSVLDVTSRDGNNKKFSGTGGIGLLTSKMEVEGPISKGKTTFILGGRTSYSNWILRSLRNKEYRNSRASFYDADLHLSHIIDDKNNLYLTGYISNDRFNLNDDTSYLYGNKNIVLQWKHIFNNKLYATFSGGIDAYSYDVKGDKKTISGFDLRYRIRQVNFRGDFSYAPNNSHSFDFGITTLHYKLKPGTFLPKGDQSLVTPDIVPDERALESALYFGDHFEINSRFSADAGFRYSVFNYLGPHDVFTYVSGLPKDISTVADTLQYGSGKIVKTYQGPELRFSLRYAFSDSASVKISYNSFRQYIHLLSNTSAISPTDIWKLSDPHIQPQAGNQVSAGFYRNFASNAIETSVEVYYKRMHNFLDYKSGASLVLNHHIETDVIKTKGYAWGAEFLIKKVAGKLNGWLSYSYSKTRLKMDDQTAGQVINKGRYYPANFDKPHNVNFISNYRFSHRFSISLNLLYSTGRPITLPVAVFNLAGSQRIYYSERNQYRIPDYFRLDFSISIEGNHKIKKLTHNSWSLGVYNLTGRKNPYSVYFLQENGRIRGYQLSVIGTAIPYITYNFRF